MSLAAGRSLPQLSRVGEAIGEELSSIGVNWYSVPAISNATALTEPLDASSSFSDDFQAVIHHAETFLDGLSRGGIAGCPKVDLTATVLEVYHANNDPHLDLAEILGQPDVLALQHSVGMRGLDSLLLTVAFEQFEDVAGAGASYGKIIQQILRQHLHYHGIVVLDSSEASGEMDICVTHAPLRGLLSGSDIVILPSDGRIQQACIQAIHAAAGSSVWPFTATTEANERITNFKRNRLGSWSALRPLSDLMALREKHASLAQNAYRRATTALSSGPSPIIHLSAQSILLLLAPSVRSVSTTSNTLMSDPFEHLGRAVASVHPRTRHVPYTLSAGLTSTHTAFLDRASAVILVLCNPSSAFDKYQEEFVRAVQDQIRIRQSRPGEQEVAKVLLAAGDPRDLNQPLKGWWEVCCYEYTAGALEAAAEVITGQRTATGCLPVKLSRYRNGVEQA